MTCYRDMAGDLRDAAEARRIGKLDILSDMSAPALEQLSYVAWEQYRFAVEVISRRARGCECPACIERRVMMALTGERDKELDRALRLRFHERMALS